MIQWRLFSSLDCHVSTNLCSNSVYLEPPVDLEPPVARLGRSLAFTRAREPLARPQLSPKQVAA